MIFVLDITPTGSLRRRRSRVPSEEDELALMDFLKSAEPDNFKERKSWGSLGNLFNLDILFQFIKLLITLMYIFFINLLFQIGHGLEEPEVVKKDLKF